MVKRIYNKTDIYDIIEYATNQDSYIKMRTHNEPAIKFISTQENYGINSEQYVQLEIDSGETEQCVILAEEIFYRYEYIAYLDKTTNKTNIIMNIISRDNEPVTDSQIKAYEDLLNTEL